MASPDSIVARIAAASSWNARVALIRRIPEDFGRAQLRDVYSAVAHEVYVPHLTPDFAYVHEREEYELASIETAVSEARHGTRDFVDTTVQDLTRTLTDHPKSMRCFRLIVGFTTREMAAATQPVAARLDVQPVSEGRIKGLEAGRSGSHAAMQVLAETIDGAVRHELFPPPGEGLRSKQDRPDLADGWRTVRRLVTQGVPYEMFLHQRHYGGAFRQLLDATSEARGNILEDAVEALASRARAAYVRTGSHNQAEIAERFHLTVQPAPDFVFHDANDSLRGLLECKMVNDGGTARDKAARFQNLRAAGQALGGVPVFAVLGGLGWTRTSDALGPVIQACDGRVFTLSTLSEMLTVDPMPSICGPSV